MAKVRLGFIGAGWWATSNHMPIFAARDDVEMAAVCRLGTAELEKVRERFGFRFATEDYRELLAQPLDAVVVSTPHSLHHEHARAALERGLHVMVEKPMTTRADHAWDLVEAARQRNLHLLVPYGWNYKGFIQDARSLIDEGVVGDIEFVGLTMASPIRQLLTGTQTHHGSDDLFAPEPATWADPDVAGGGYAHAQLSHATGLLFYLTSLRASEAFAFMSGPGAQVELHDAISVRFQNGAIGTVAGSSGIPGNHRFQLDLRIFGRDGMLLLDVERERLELRREDGRVVNPAIPAGAGDYSCEAPPNHFIDLIAGRVTENPSSGEIAARSVELIDAAYRSAAAGHSVRVLGAER